MSHSVILKSNKYGINLILDDELSFDALLEEIIVKFKESERFFKGASLGISFEGRDLTEVEQYEIIHQITEQTDVKIACIFDHDKEKEEMMRRQLEAFDLGEALNNGQFYKGTFRSGQQIECEGSIVVLGDVNPGAKIIAKGNIVILGSLKGYAYAGAGGNESAFVAALDMNPMQIKIGDVIARSQDQAPWSKKKKSRKKMQISEPQIATVQEGNIYIEPMVP